MKSITRPAVGNHEYRRRHGYFDYFNGAGKANGTAGNRGKGYYSYDVGSWHLVSLNSNCKAAESATRVPRRSAGCAPTSPPTGKPAPSPTGITPASAPGMTATTCAPADSGRRSTTPAPSCLNGHGHNYERYAPRTRAAKLDRNDGVREFVVGTGGAFFTGLSTKKAEQ